MKQEQSSSGKTNPDRTTPMPADHEYASPESGDRAQPTQSGSAPRSESGPATDPIPPKPVVNELASPESGDRAVLPSNRGAENG